MEAAKIGAIKVQNLILSICFMLTVVGIAVASSGELEPPSVYEMVEMVTPLLSSASHPSLSTKTCE